jgi:type IV pilus assembly protein PilX
MVIPNRTSALGFRRARGIALFISLVFLLITTILGVSVVQTTSLEIRMARNSHDTLLAFEAAESALRDAEVQLEATTSTFGFTDGGADGLWTVAELGELNRWEDGTIWEDASTQSAIAPTGVGGVSKQPRYIIEHVASVLRAENAYQMDDPYAGSASDRVEMFRVTALGFGGSETTTVMVQTTYGRVLD